MKMKSLKAQFIGAIAMVLVAAVAMGSSTYAWFAMNTSVDATGMAVSVNSQSTYLIISRAYKDAASTTDATQIQAENSNAGFLSVEFDAAAAELYPVAPAISFADAVLYTAQDPEVIAGSKHVGEVKTDNDLGTYTPGAGAGAPAVWYTKVGTNATSSGYVGKEGSAANVTSAVTAAPYGANGYVLKHTLYMTLAAGSDAATNLQVDSITISVPNTGTTAPVRCLVVGAAGSHLYTATSEDDSAVLVASLDNSHVYTVDVYIYYDGNDSAVFTNNIPSIKDCTVGITFKVTNS